MKECVRPRNVGCEVKLLQTNLCTVFRSTDDMTSNTSSQQGERGILAARPSSSPLDRKPPPHHCVPLQPSDQLPLIGPLPTPLVYLLSTRRSNLETSPFFM